MSGRFWAGVILLVLVAGVFIGYYYFWGGTTSVSPSIVNSNPDIVISSFGNLSDGKARYGDWILNGIHLYEDGPLPQDNNNSGIIAMHPQNASTPSKLSREFDLPDSNQINLNLVVSNVAELIGKECEFRCSDSVVKIKVRDMSTLETETLETQILEPANGWVSMDYDISRYSGKNVEVVVEGWGGGPCTDFCGEWTGVDYLGIVAA